MTDVLFQIHMWVGYVVAVILLLSAGMAFGRAKDAREFNRSPYTVPMAALDVQVVLGLALYGIGGYWEADVVGPWLAYVHPSLALLALVVGHVLVKRARSHQQVVDAHRTAGRGLAAALVLAVAAVVVAVAA